MLDCILDSRAIRRASIEDPHVALYLCTLNRPFLDRRRRSSRNLATGSSTLVGAVLCPSPWGFDRSRGVTKVSGSVQYDAANPGKSSIQATIDASSVDTRVEMRDNDLRSSNFLDVQKFPTITFNSKKVEGAGAGKLKVTGDLTIHGVTKEVVLDVDGPTAPMKDPWGNQRMGASATTKIIARSLESAAVPACRRRD